jgi:hypothetical protein
MVGTKDWLNVSSTKRRVKHDLPELLLPTIRTLRAVTPPEVDGEAMVRFNK